MNRALSPDLLARCHRNAIEDYRAFALCATGAMVEEHEGSLFVNLGGGDSMENVAFITEARTDPPGALDLAERFFERNPHPWSVILHPNVQKAMRPVLAARRFFDEGKFPGMVLHPLPERPLEPPGGLRIVRVETLDQLVDLQHAASRSFGGPYEAPEASWLEAKGLTWYVGYENRTPVVHGILVVTHGIAGVAYVGTAPEGRRRGFARALVSRIVSDGRGQGCDAAYLWATPMGSHVYPSLGFRTILEYEIWSVPGSPLPKAIRGE
ncbi:MAG TPA: GNAT family N-acetyltransferase [Thermoplasmata archaeon]|nr:GNAT family N-acetyltransferase [Thermoplasmata archaeon]